MKSLTYKHRYPDVTLASSQLAAITAGSMFFLSGSLDQAVSDFVEYVLHARDRPQIHRSLHTARHWHKAAAASVRGQHDVALLLALF
jgi:hypothetical protein